MQPTRPSWACVHSTGWVQKLIIWIWASRISGSVAGFASLGPVVDVFAKGGLVNWKSKITASKSELFSRDGTDLVYGGGLVVHLLSLSVRAEYEHFNIDAGANLVSLGVTWTFL